MSAASVLLLWRIWILPVRELWSDPVAILAAYWLFLLRGHTTRAKWPVTFLVMTGLFVIYTWKHLPHPVSILELKP